MSPRGQEKNEQMRAEALEKITNAAFDVFSDFGYHGTTMKKIAGATGLSYGLVYHYFSSKEKLFLHLIEIALDKSIDTLNIGLDTPGSAWEKINNLSALMVKEAIEGDSSRYFIIMLQAMTQGKSIPGLMDYIETRSAAHYEKLVPVIIQAQQSGDAANDDPGLLAAAYFSFIQGFSLLVSQERKMERRINPAILTNILRNNQ